MKHSSFFFTGNIVRNFSIPTTTKARSKTVQERSSGNRFLSNCSPFLLLDLQNGIHRGILIRGYIPHLFHCCTRVITPPQHQK